MRKDKEENNNEDDEETNKEQEKQEEEQQQNDRRREIEREQSVDKWLRTIDRLWLPVGRADTNKLTIFFLKKEQKKNTCEIHRLMSRMSNRLIIKINRNSTNTRPK